MLVQMTVERFLEELGSSSPAPGGGSVAALSGALGAALVSMVCQLSISKKGYESFEASLKKGLAEAAALANGLLKRVDLDTEAFNGVMAAFRMPKETEGEKAARTEAIQRGYKEAVQSPLGVARECLGVLKVAEALLGKTNVNALSDLGVASLQAYAGLEGAIMNVRINLPSIKDAKFVNSTSTEVSDLQKEGIRIRNTVERHFYEKVA